MRSLRASFEHPVSVSEDEQGWTWSVACADGRRLSGQAPNSGVARRYGDFVAANLGALQRAGQRRF